MGSQIRWSSANGKLQRRGWFNIKADEQSMEWILNVYATQGSDGKESYSKIEIKINDQYTDINISKAADCLFLSRNMYTNKFSRVSLASRTEFEEYSAETLKTSGQMWFAVQKGDVNNHCVLITLINQHY